MNPVQRGYGGDREQKGTASLHFGKSATFCRKSCFNQSMTMCTPDQWANRHNSSEFCIPVLCPKEKKFRKLVLGWLTKAPRSRGEITRLVLGGCRMSRSPYLPTRILKVYTEAFTGFSHVCHPDGLNNTLLSQGYILKNGSHFGNSGQNVQSKDGEGVRSLRLPKSSLQVNWQSCPLNDILQQYPV